MKILSVIACLFSLLAVSANPLLIRQDLGDTAQTLDQGVIQIQQANENATAGQAASLTSQNNYINFCKGQPLTNGTQVKTGSCNPVPMGMLMANNLIPHSRFINPKNFQQIPADTTFRIEMQVQNIQLGTFTNAQLNYYSAPAQLNGEGVLIGHTHYVIQEIQSFTSTEMLDPLKFAFFKGDNNPAVNGVAGVEVPGGLSAGFYRLGSINAASNHQPVIAPVAQHGMIDDIVYFEVVGGNEGDAPPDDDTNDGNDDNVNDDVDTAASLQTFTGTLGGSPAPAVDSAGSGKFKVEGVNDLFNDAKSAVDRSCSIQNNVCADASNASGGREFSVGDCSKQLAECQALNQ